MDSKISPLQDYVVAKRIKEQQGRTSSGIILPDTSTEKPQLATVIAVGPGKVNNEGASIPMQVEVGDRVLIGKYSGTEIELDETYVIVQQSDILAKV